MRSWGSTRPNGENAFSAMPALVRLAVLHGRCSFSARALTAVGPVTDGDALCYHLQVPKVFLIRQSVGLLPDLHETVYPLLTELLYAVKAALDGWAGPRWPAAGSSGSWAWYSPLNVHRRWARPSLWSSESAVVGRARLPCFHPQGGVQRHVSPPQRRRAGRVRHGGDFRVGPAP